MTIPGTSRNDGAPKGFRHSGVHCPDSTKAASVPGPAAGLPYYDAEAIRAALPPADAVEALRSALAAGLDPAADPPRVRMPLSHGEFLLMPSEFGADVGVKVLTIVPGNTARNIPRDPGVVHSVQRRNGYADCAVGRNRDDRPAHRRGVACRGARPCAGRRAPAAGGRLRRRHPGEQSPAHIVCGGGRQACRRRCGDGRAQAA